MAWARLPREVSGVLLALAASLAAHASAQQVPVFRSGVDLTTFGVTVTDRRGTPVRGFTAEDFELYEDGKPQKLAAFQAVEIPVERQEPPSPKRVCSSSTTIT